MRVNQSFLLFLPITWQLTASLNAQEATERPNIVIILADDMGYCDIGCYGGEVKTPNLDKLAAEGLRFTNFYNNAKCGSTRAALLTGHYAHDTRLKKSITIADAAKSAGYRTLMAGKWHQEGNPTSFGFDRYTGLLDGCCNFWNPGLDAKKGEPKPGRKTFMVNQKKSRVWGIEKQAFENYVPEDPNFYTTDLFTNYAVERLEEYKDEAKPFLLYLSYTAPHYPLHAWPEDIAKYKDTYAIGWDSIREQRFARLKTMGLIPETTSLTPRNPEVKAWTTLSKEERARESYKMAVYAAMIDRMDQGIGKVLTKLDEIKKRENTLILFLSDNGAEPSAADFDPNVPPGPVESYRAIGRGWANLSNLPYRGFKSTSFEGGTKTPLIASWPAQITNTGLNHGMGHVMDFLPTVIELSGATYPTQIRDHEVVLPHGHSLVPLLHGKPRPGYEQLFFSFGDSRAVIEGDWKLVRANRKNASWELYNLSQDPTERNNLATKHSERIADLTAKITRWNKEGILYQTGNSHHSKKN